MHILCIHVSCMYDFIGRKKMTTHTHSGAEEIERSKPNENKTQERKKKKHPNYVERCFESITTFSIAACNATLYKLVY